MGIWVPYVRTNDCDPTGLDDTLSKTSESIDWVLRYTEEPTDALYFSSSDAQMILDSLDFAKQKYVDEWSMVDPYLSTEPDGNMLVHDEPLQAAWSQSCVTYDPDFLTGQTVDWFRLATNHELFHGRQCQYRVNGGAADYGGLGTWVIEGSARCLDDRFDAVWDTGTWFSGEVSNLMTGSSDGGTPYRDLSLFSLSYRACLFWSYGCEQYGTMNFEPDSGADFIRRFWENIRDDYAADEITDPLYSLGRLLADSNGPSVHEHWHRYVTSLMTREFDVTALPNGDRYAYVDEAPAGGGTVYKNMKRRKSFDGDGAVPQMNSDSVEAYGNVFYEISGPTPQGSVCEIIGVRGTADEEVAWSLIGVKAPLVPGDPERAVVLSRRRGREFDRAMLYSFDDSFTRLGFVVAGLDDAASYDFTIDRGVPFPSIVRPTASKPAYPGPSGTKGRFLVRVSVSGPDGLKPDGIGNLSVAGLTAEQFGVRVGGIDATILNGSYVGTEYWLVVETPEQLADGTYDLQVLLCADAILPTITTATDAVVIGDYRINHVLVLDRSGSMQYPDDGSGTKLEAAKNAVSLYADAVNDTDRIGFVWFSGNDTSCDEDAMTPEGLDDATGLKRGAVQGAASGLGPSGWTSIGDGLWNAQDEFDGLPAVENQVNWVVLLSDGDENEDRFWASSVACAGDLGDNAKDRITPTDTRINAMAFGPESDQPLMQEIGDSTDGDYSYIPVAESGAAIAAVTGNAQAAALANAYISAVKNARGLEELFHFESTVSSGAPTVLNIDVQEPGYVDGTFAFNWTSSTPTVTVELRDPANNLITAAEATIFTEPTHVVYHVNGELAQGQWTATINTDQDLDLLAAVLARQEDGLQLRTTVAQINTGGAFALEGVFGPFEHGVPVRILALVSDGSGPVLGGTGNAVVTMPDGSLACPTLVLYDDGAHQDGEPDDGVYGAVFTATTQASWPFGTVNDNPLNPNPGGSTGTYRVDLSFSKTGQSGPINRHDVLWFNVQQTLTSLDDSDLDGIPDTYEVHYGLNPLVDDSALDPDEDGLSNLREFINGCHPFDDDTDHGGEQDGSEVGAGLCPIDPADDRLPAPVAVAVDDTVGDGDIQTLLPLANRLMFPVHPAYLQMRVYRSLIPSNFSLLTTLNRASLLDGFEYDEGLVDGTKYYYRFQGVGASGEVSRLSRIVSGTARLNPVPPQGFIFVNNNDDVTESADVLVHLYYSDDVTHYRIANQQIGDGFVPPLIPVPVDDEVPWTLDLPAPGDFTRVFVQFVNGFGLGSEIAQDSIIFDCPPAASPLAAPDGIARNRYVSFVGANPGRETAIRVTPLGGGDALWVGPPKDYPEEDSSNPTRTFVGAGLQCDPYYRDWSTLGVVEVFGAEFIPQGVYDVQAIAQCASLTVETNFSAPLTITNAKFGDVVAPYFVNAGDPQPDFKDISAYVAKFLADPTAPTKAVAQLQPNVVKPIEPINFKDISADVDAFLGVPYAAMQFVTGPCACPSTVTCGATLCNSDLDCAAGLCIEGGCTDECGRCMP